MNRPKKQWTKQEDASERVLLASFNVKVYYELMTTEEIDRARTSYYNHREQTILLYLQHPTRESNPRPPD